MAEGGGRAECGRELSFPMLLASHMQRIAHAIKCYDTQP